MTAKVIQLRPEKICRKCGQPGEFHRNRRVCKKCVNAASLAWRHEHPRITTKEQIREKSRRYYAKHTAKQLAAGARWRAANPDKVSALVRVSHLRKFGLKVGDYDRMLVAQNGVCAICRKPESQVLRGKVKRLAIDHDHTTGAVRGLLCSGCNPGLGHFGDDPLLLRAAADYLEKNS